MKLVDVDYALKYLPNDLPYKASVKRVFAQLPEAAVRCAECKYHWQIATRDKWFCARTGTDLNQTELSHHFCSYGEK